MDTFEHGKIQPQAVDLEEAVLGAMMLEADACSLAFEKIKTNEVFYKDQHKHLFNVMKELYFENNPVDILTVTEKSKSKGLLEECGGAYYITQLTNRVSSSANTEYHILIILDKFLKRELIRLGSETIRMSFDDENDVFAIMDGTVMSVMGLYSNLDFNNSGRVGDIAKENNIIIKNSKNSELIGLPSGFKVIDHVINGWQNGDLIIVAGRPGMGKTAFGVSLVYNMAVENKIPVGFISLEMTKNQVVMRLQSIMAGVNYQELRGGRINESQLMIIDKDLITLNDTPAYIDDSSAITIVQLRAKALNFVKNHKVKMIFIDYLQLMNGVGKKGQNREQEVSDISRGLKALAKELNIPIMAFSQLSRKVEDRGGDKRPRLSDLRESGAIEQDADVVIFLYRPEYYGINEDEMGNSYENVGIAIVEKHRNGATGEFKLNFNKSLMRYHNFDGDFKEIPTSQTSLEEFFDDKINSNEMF